MNYLIEFFNNNKSLFIYFFIFIFSLWGVLYFTFPEKKKVERPTPAIVMQTSEVKNEDKNIVIEIDDSEELLQIQEVEIIEEKTDNNIQVYKDVSPKIYVLSSKNIGDYTITLGSYTKVENLIQTDTLYCLLELNEKNLSFNLPINKKILKDIDEVFIKVATNKTHSVIEDAYVLKELKEDMDYFLKLLLYDDYVSLSLNEFEKKKQNELKMTSDVKINISQFTPSQFPEIKEIPTELKKDILVNTNKFESVN